MADNTEHVAPVNEKAAVPVSTTSPEIVGGPEEHGKLEDLKDASDLKPEYDAERTASTVGPSWMYRKWAFTNGNYYASPATQIILVAMVCFLCPGMFNSINGLGAGGQVSTTISNKANTAVYATFSIVGFFAGSIANRMGIKLTLSIGGLGYCVYTAGFLCYNHTKNEGFVIFGGAFLGACAGLLWAAQGAIMMSYPSEQDKGKYISWFWMIFNTGGVLGSLIPLAENLQSKSGTANDGTYAGFIVLMIIGAALAWSLVDADKVVRKDGSKVILMKHPTWQTEIFGLWEVLRTDYYIILFFPLFFASNFFYTYQQQDVNAARFTLRTRALNGLLYWFAQIVAALVWGYLMDLKRFSRPTRAKGVLLGLFALTMIIYGGGFDYQKTYVRDPRTLLATPTDPAKAKALADAIEASKMDWTSPGYVGPMFLYFFYGIFDACWQTSVYWFMGSLSNNSRKLANFAGFYKGIQSAGGAIAATIDGNNPAYMSEFAGNWILLAGSLVIAAPVIWFKVKETTLLSDDVAFSDETVEDVKEGAGIH